jgi:flagellar protein FliL
MRLVAIGLQPSRAFSLTDRPTGLHLVAAPAPVPASAAAAQPAAPAPKGKKKLLVMMMATVLLAAGGGTAYFMLQGGDDEVSELAELDEATELARVKKRIEENKQKIEDAKNKKKKKVIPKEALTQTDFYPVDPWFTFNLMDKDPERTGQIGIVYEVADKKSGEALKQKLPVIRSKILLLITGKHASDVRSPDGKQQLADEILGLTKGVLSPTGTEDGVKAVHFAIFVIQ